MPTVDDNEEREDETKEMQRSVHQGDARSRQRHTAEHACEVYRQEQNVQCDVEVDLVCALFEFGAAVGRRHGDADEVATSFIELCGEE